MKNDETEDDVRAAWRSQNEQTLIMPREELQRKVRRLEAKIAWRNAGEYGAAALIAAANIYYFLYFDSALLRIGSALIVAGVAYTVWQLHRNGSAIALPPDAVAGTSLDFLMMQLKRQRDLLRRIWSWYLLPLFPGLIVFLLGLARLRSPSGATPALSESSIVHTAAACVVGFALIAWLNSAAARKLEREIQCLGDLRKS